MQRNTFLPIILAGATFVLVALALWPQEEPTTTFVVAGRDLGAGTILAPADLAMVTLPSEQAPPDPVSDPALLVGESLAVVRFQGEPITPRHLGPAVILAPDERGIAVRVQADTGLAGLLRPGMEVGVIATLPVANAPNSLTPGGESVYAKSVLEGLRVLYVPPSFQARPSPSLADPTTEGVFTSAPQEPPREGVIVLAAGTLPEPVVYQEPEQILAQVLAKEKDTTPGENPRADTPSEEPSRIVWAVPVELLAALNASDAAFTLVLTPEKAKGYVTPGISVREMER